MVCPAASTAATDSLLVIVFCVCGRRFSQADGGGSWRFATRWSQISKGALGSRRLRPCPLRAQCSIYTRSVSALFARQSAKSGDESGSSSDEEDGSGTVKRVRKNSRAAAEEAAS
jgi:hypothetical protein